MEKCDKHGCELVVKEMSVGWGGISKIVCPECEKEKSKNGQSETVFSAAKAGWQ